MFTKLRRHRPSHATVVAYLALFVALGGSAYAVTMVTGKDIRNRSITKADIRKNTLTGSEILERRLGRVRRAVRARTADSAAISLQAGSAASADIAKNSEALAGQGAGFFEKASRTGFGRASLDPAGESGERVVLSWAEMGVELTSATDQASCGGDLKLAVKNTNSGGDPIQILEAGGSGSTVAPGAKAYPCGVANGADLALADAVGRVLFVDCAPAGGELRCVGTRSEP